MPRDSLKCLLERQFLADEGSLDDVDISHQVAALSADDCASIVTQLLAYFDACISRLKTRVSCIQCFCLFIYYETSYICNHRLSI